MAGVTAARFKSREAALRFYFRASTLLMPNAKPGVFSSRRPPKIHPGPNIVHDLFALDACFHGLNDVQLWLLHQLFRPGGFRTRQPALADIAEAARARFPEQQWTLPRMAQMRREALNIFEAHLVRQRLV